MNLPIEPGCLALVIDNWTSPSSSVFPARRVAKANAGGAVGRVVEVVRLNECGCCASVLPTWQAYPDPGGLKCNKRNLLRVDGGSDEQETENAHDLELVT